MDLLPFTMSGNVTAHPFWHRKSPLLSTVHVDPGFEVLRSAFPDSWSQLMRTKSLLDAVETIQSREASTSGTPDRIIRTLISEAAHELARVADKQAARGEGGLASAAAEYSRLLETYARTGEWTEHVVHRPDQGAPWLYCGPLATTWRSNQSAGPVSLLVAVPDSRRQPSVSLVDENLNVMRAVVEAALGPGAQLSDDLPDMHAMELLLGGGSITAGHKSFAHFLPIETDKGVTTGRPFTVVFTNVHQTRIERCSLPLLDAATGRASALHAADEVVSASLVWFRGHDVGHFWRAGDAAPDLSHQAAALSPFECVSLEETFADTIGLLTARELVEREPLSAAYNAELMRYLSGDERRFADTVSALLEVGWLDRGSVFLPTEDPSWLKSAGESLQSLARTVHDVLWRGSETDLEPLRHALKSGEAVMDRYAHIMQRIPTDLTYVFG